MTRRQRIIFRNPHPHNPFVSNGAMITAMDEGKKLGLDAESLIQKFEEVDLKPTGSFWTSAEIISAAEELEKIKARRNKKNTEKKATVSRTKKNVSIMRKTIGLLKIKITKIIESPEFILYVLFAFILFFFLISTLTSYLEKQDMVIELENENLSLKMQINALEKELASRNSQPVNLLPETNVRFIDYSGSNEKIFPQTIPVHIVQKDESVWQILTKKLGHEPTVEQIKDIVTENNLPEKTDVGGRWIVIIQPGQTLYLSSVFS